MIYVFLLEIIVFCLVNDKVQINNKREKEISKLEFNPILTK